MSPEDTMTQTQEAQAQPQEAQAQPQEAQAQPAAATVQVQEPVFPQAPEGVPGQPGPVDILLDTTVSVQVCLDEVDVVVRELLQLGPGSVLKLRKQAGEPVDLYIRGIKFATGHLVVVGEQLGVRIKEILPSPCAAAPARP